MFSRVIIGLSLSVLGIFFGILLYNDHPQKNIFSINYPLNQYSNELNTIVKSIRKIDSDTVKNKVLKARSIVDTTQLTIDNIRFTMGAVNIKKSIDSHKNNLKGVIQLIDDASQEIDDITEQIASLEGRISQIDKNMTQELNSNENNLSSNSNSGVQFTNIWLPMLVSIMGLLSGLSTILLGWRKDRREFLELRATLGNIRN